MNSNKLGQTKCANIYGLIDPSDSTIIHYVGQTTRSLKQRLQSGYGYSGMPVGDWIRSLDKPLQHIILECCPINMADQRERFWINKLRTEGHPLKNRSTGGRCNFKLHAETKRKIALAISGIVRSPKTRAKISKGASGHRNANYGKTGLDNPAFNFRNHRIAEKAKSPEVRAKNSAAIRALWTDPKWREAMLAARQCKRKIQIINSNEI